MSLAEKDVLNLDDQMAAAQKAIETLFRSEVVSVGDVTQTMVFSSYTVRVAPEQNKCDSWGHFSLLAPSPSLHPSSLWAHALRRK